MMSQMPQDSALESVLTIQPGEVVIGKMIKFDQDVWVDYPGNPNPQAIRALTTVPLTQAHVGREIALLFAQGDLNQPVVMGLIHTTEPQTAPIEAQVDGERVVLSAQKEIVLKCGKASITLTQAGKVLIRGAYVLSRSSGVNRIRGGSVQMN